MGCDGGTIPRRDELVRLKKKPEQKDKDSELSFRWQHCAVSQQPLQEPIVGCGLGRLYSKSSLIEALLDKNLLPDTAKHIRNLKDVKDLNLTANPAYLPESTGYGAPYICPVIGLEMTGRFRFIFLWSCGCVFSERALKFVNATTCHKCQKPFTEDDIIVLNGTEEDVAVLQINMEARNAKLKAEKKMKKTVKVETMVKIQDTDTSKDTKIQDTSKDTKIKAQDTSKDTKIQDTSKDTNIKAQDTSKDTKIKPQDKDTTNKIKQNGSKAIKKETTVKKETSKTGNASTSKLSGSESSQKSLKRTALGESLADPAFKKSKDNYSVSKDPKATEVFKSLFTSHVSAAEQERAHWITYNPFYN